MFKNIKNVSELLELQAMENPDRMSIVKKKGSLVILNILVMTLRLLILG